MHLHETQRTAHEDYCVRTLYLETALGSRRALARQLGVRHSTLTRRLKNPSMLKREHILALEALMNRLKGPIIRPIMRGANVNAERQT